MKSFPLAFIAFLFVLNISAQIRFEPGYIVLNSDQRTEVLIRNLDWKNNPEQFVYKPANEGEEIVGTLRTVKEFGVYGGQRFIRATVDVDQSSNDLGTLSNNRNPENRQETLFLRKLVEGSSNLYFYEDGNLRRFFFAPDNGNIIPLIFKRYRQATTKIGENVTFRQQLWNSLQCKGIKRSRFDRLDYEQTALENLFADYNRCVDPDNIILERPDENPSLFNFAVKAGIQTTSLSIRNEFSGLRNSDFDSKWGFRVGLGLEAILPFNNNKWALMLEPTFQSYRNDGQPQANNSNFMVQVEADYSSVEIFFGPRYYLFLSDTNKLFINGGAVYDIPFTGDIIFEGSLGDLEMASAANWAFGVGFQTNKVSLEVRYLTNRDSLRRYQDWFADYGGVAIVAGFSIF